MGKATARALQKSRSGTFNLQITSMIDMFTILLVFLLKSYNTSSVMVNPQSGLILPQSNAQVEPVEALKLSVSAQGIYVDEKLIVPLVNGQIDKKLTDPNDGKFIKTLFQELNQQAQKTKDIASKNESVAFDGRVIFQADRDLPYDVLKKVMYTASLAGYADFKFAVVGK